MRCPFCKSRLKPLNFVWHTTYYCESEDCVDSDVSRYEATYNNYPTYLMSRTFRLGDCYIQIDLKNNKTVISKIMACVLFDIIEIPRALEVNLKNPSELLKKVRTLMVFS